MNLREVSTIGLCPLDTTEIIRSRKKDGRKFLKNPYAFDIEVTNYQDGDIKTGIVYLWTLALSKTEVVYGRTIEEFINFCKNIEEVLEEKEIYLVIYVHNLAYEFQFLRNYFDWSEVFVLDKRRPLYAETGHIIFRCSYMLSNMSLENFLKNNNCVLQKLEYDYNKQRFPWDELTQDEINYCAHDTAGLLEALENILLKDKDNITSIPLTSTGYVRREIKKSQPPAVRKKIQTLSRITPDLYYALHAAFTGGNTHASRFFVNCELENVTCYDISSSYPYVQLVSDFPVTPFREKTDNLDNIKLDKKFAYLLLVEFENMEVIPWDGMPNISHSKCEEIKNYTLDNGRILKAEKVKIWLTDIEFHITEHHYTWDAIKYKKVYYSRYGKLPDCIKSCIYEYYENKCKLKKKDPYLYRKSKEKLNSIYGMSAFDIGKKRYSWENNDYKKDTRPESVILSEALKSTQAEPYIWGVWTTARARENLDEVIRLAGESFVYCDTDSVYSLDELDLKEINQRIYEKSKEFGVNYEGREFYCGKWEIDKRCLKFRTLGAKKYCYEDESGIHTVTAGVSKKAGVRDVKDYKIGYTFKNATNSAWYEDEEITLKINGHTLTIPSSVYIESNDYTLGYTENYRSLLYYLYYGEGDLIFYE